MSKKLGDLVKATRLNSRLSLSDVGADAHLSKAHICDIEKGIARNPRVSTLLGLGFALQINPILLFSAALEDQPGVSRAAPSKAESWGQGDQHSKGGLRREGDSPMTLPDEADSSLRDRRSEMDAPQTLTPDDLSSLREAAGEATPGPWVIDSYISKPGDTPDAWHVYEWGEDDPPLATLSWLKPKENAKFIALCSPDRILALLGMLEEAQNRSWKDFNETVQSAQLSTAIRERDEAIACIKSALPRLTSMGQGAAHPDVIRRARAILASSDKKDSADA